MSYYYKQIQGYSSGGSVSFSTQITNNTTIRNYSHRNYSASPIQQDKEIIYPFLERERYYLIFSVTKDPNIPQTIQISLFESNSVQNPKNFFIKEINVEKGNEKVYFQLIFSPDLNCYSHLYLNTVRGTGENNFPFNRTNTIDDIQIYQLENILSANSDNNLNNDIIVKQIGIQSAPNSLFCINNDEIKIGPSGLFEATNNSINIYFIGVAPTEEVTNKFFIIDYLYQNK